MPQIATWRAAEDTRLERSRLRAVQRVNEFQDLGVVANVSAGLVFGVDQRAVDLHVEDAAVAGDELGLRAELRFDRVRQTGGDGIVVSDLAELDGHVHGRPPRESRDSLRQVESAASAGRLRPRGFPERRVGSGSAV
jgi:hypothetical protein